MHIAAAGAVYLARPACLHNGRRPGKWQFGCHVCSHVVGTLQVMPLAAVTEVQLPVHFKVPHAPLY